MTYYATVCACCGDDCTYPISAKSRPRCSFCRNRCSRMTGQPCNRYTRPLGYQSVRTATDAATHPRQRRGSFFDSGARRAPSLRSPASAAALAQATHDHSERRSPNHSTNSIGESSRVRPNAALKDGSDSADGELTSRKAGQRGSPSQRVARSWGAETPASSHSPR